MRRMTWMSAMMVCALFLVAAQSQASGKSAKKKKNPFQKYLDNIEKIQQKIDALDPDKAERKINKLDGKMEREQKKLNKAVEKMKKPLQKKQNLLEGQIEKAADKGKKTDKLEKQLEQVLQQLDQIEKWADYSGEEEKEDKDEDEKTGKKK